MTDTELPEYSIGPTHKCAKCGAQWRFNPEHTTPWGTHYDASWSVKSFPFGQCCDRASGDVMDLIMIPLDAEPL